MLQISRQFIVSIN